MNQFCIQMLLVALSFPNLLLAQKYWDETQIKVYMSAMNDIQLTDESTDQILSIVNHLKTHPIALNQANIYDLLVIPLVGVKQARAILEHRNKFGLFMHTAELAAVQNLSMQEASWIAQFVGTANNFTQSVTQQPMVQLIQTHLYKNQQQANFLGDAWQHRIKGILQLTSRLQVGFQLEKDNGEPWLKTQKGLFDYHSFHLKIEKTGIIQNAIVGDFEMQTGQGLSLGMGYRMRLAADPIQTIQLLGTLNAHRSFDENNFIRGIAVSINWKQINISPFIGQRKTDGNIKDDSSNTQSILVSESANGYHRTVSEMKNKNTLIQPIMGLYLNKEIGNLTVGMSYFNLSQIANKPVIAKHPRTLYNRSLKNYSNFGVDLIYQLDQLILTAAYSCDNNKDDALYLAIMKSFGSELDWGLSYRYYSPFYANPLAGGPIEFPTKNQSGLFQSFAFTPSKKWEFKAFLDIYKRQWLSSSQLVLDEQCNLSIQAIHKPHAKKQMSVQYRLNRKLSNETLITHEVPLHQFGLHYSIELNSNFTIEGKFQQVELTGKTKSSSKLFYECFTYKGKKVTMDIQLNQFENSLTESLPVYVHEHDLSGQSGLQVYYGTGYAASVVLKLKIFKHLKLATKIGTSKLQLSSGFVNSFKFQVIWQ